MPVVVNMYHWARASSLGDDFLPFSFAQMGANINVARGLVGETIWKAFFPTEQMEAYHVCPMVLRRLMFRQLMTYADMVNKDAKKKEHQEAAKKMLSEASTELMGRRRALRLSPYGSS